MHKELGEHQDILILVLPACIVKLEMRHTEGLPSTLHFLQIYEVRYCFCIVFSFMYHVFHLYLQKCLVHDCARICTVVRKGVGEVVHIVWSHPVILHTGDMQLQKLFFVHSFASGMEMR